MSFLEKFILGFWNIGVINENIRNILQEKKVKIHWVKHRFKDRFFADPFLYDIDNDNYYILAEEFPFWTNKGYISLLTVNKKKMYLIKKEKIIDSEFHLSYPIIYHNQIIPESYRSNKCLGYSIKDKRIIRTNEIAPFGLIDQTFLEYNGYEWIFATDKENPLAGLKIFYRYVGGENWIAHKKNPISEDISSARPGGHFFWLGNTLYRPVQDSKKLYGHQIHIMRVDHLSTEDYIETKVATFNSEDNPPYDMGLHTFNVENDFVIVDGYREYHSLFIKPLIVLKNKLKK